MIQHKTTNIRIKTGKANRRSSAGGTAATRAWHEATL